MTHTQEHNYEKDNYAGKVGFLGYIKKYILWFLGFSKASTDRTLLNKKKWYRAVKVLWVILFVAIIAITLSDSYSPIKDIFLILVIFRIIQLAFFYIVIEEKP